MPHRIIRPCIVRGVKPYQLIAALMHRDGLRTLPLAKKMGKPALQPQLHRFVRGEVPSPDHTTAAPLAAHFKLPLDAIYEEKVATAIAAAQGLKVVDWPPQATRRKERPAAPNDAVRATLALYERLGPEGRRLFAQLAAAAESPPPAPEVAPGVVPFKGKNRRIKRVSNFPDDRRAPDEAPATEPKKASK